MAPDPNDVFSEAVRKAMQLIGAKHVADVVRRSVPLVYKWSDPKLRLTPTLSQALLLDTEIVRQGYRDPVFLVAYTSALRVGLSSDAPDQAPAIVKAIGLVNKAVALLGKLARFQTAEGVGEDELSLHRDLFEIEKLLTSLRWRLGADKAKPPGKTVV